MMFMKCVIFQMGSAGGGGVLLSDSRIVAEPHHIQGMEMVLNGERCWTGILIEDLLSRMADI